jgi:hypothetical protein
MSLSCEKLYIFFKDFDFTFSFLEISNKRDQIQRIFVFQHWFWPKIALQMAVSGDAYACQSKDFAPFNKFTYSKRPKNDDDSQLPSYTISHLRGPWS